MDIKKLHKYLSSLPSTPPMPVIFAGHGTPMNAIENNAFTQGWVNAVKSAPKPKAIVCISAHWETGGTFVTAMPEPRTIYDFYGFPPELYAQTYPAKGDVELAEAIIHQSATIKIGADTTWGLDHGTWSVLKHMYPDADIPVLQISIDHFKDAEWHYEFAQSLAYLRTKGVLVVGSGNITHNLRMVKLKGNDFNVDFGYDWAYEIQAVIKEKIRTNDINALVNYNHLHSDIRLAIPTPEHYLPFLYTLALKTEQSNISIFNDTVVAGSLDMLSLLISDHV